MSAMPEPVLHGDLPGWPRPFAPDPAAEAALLAELDELLITQLVRRVRQARGEQLNRRAAGLPATNLAQENAMLRQYAARLGEPGVSIAHAILELSRPPADGRRD
jgi:chorismate mutase